MSCKHGNWSGCELCADEDDKWAAGFNAGKESSSEKFKLLLRECDAMLGMLSSAQPVEQLRAEIAKVLE